VDESLGGNFRLVVIATVGREHVADYRPQLSTVRDWVKDDVPADTVRISSRSVCRCIHAGFVGGGGVLCFARFLTTGSHDPSERRSMVVVEVEGVHLDQ
jgi:hypothetical protein